MAFPQLELPVLSSGWVSDEPPGVMTRAALYAAVHERRREDVAIYLALAAAVEGPVLELGAGSGRLLAPLLARGIDARGLECDAEAIESGRRRLRALGVSDPHERLLAGDMRAFELQRRFGAIFVAANTLSLLLGEADLEATFAAVVRHLAPGGVFVFDVSRLEGYAWYRPPYRFRGEPEGVWVAGLAATCVESGVFEPETRRCSVTREFTSSDGTKAALHTLTHQRSVEHWLTSLRRTGLEPSEPIDERGGAVRPESTLVFLQSSVPS
jgi:SAM-dependent methyltransferase